MSEELAGKVAIVTGAASGMGRESVRRFHAEGAAVVVADVSDDAGAKLAAELGGRARYRHCDVSKADEVEGLVDFCVSEFGQVDIMFNNAGMTGDTRHIDFFEDGFGDLLRIVSVDLLGVMLGCRFAGKVMAERGTGSIINTASTAGFLGGLGILPYRAAKAGVLNFTQNAALVLGPHGIRVDAISPGAVETPILTAGLPLSDDGKAKVMREVMDILVHNQAMKRYGQPGDIADAAVFLASDRSVQITGQNLVVSGGQGIGDQTDWLADVNAVLTRAMGGKASPAAA